MHERIYTTDQAVEIAWRHRLDTESLIVAKDVPENVAYELVRSGMATPMPDGDNYAFTQKFVKTYLRKVENAVQVGGETYLAPEGW